MSTLFVNPEIWRSKDVYATTIAAIRSKVGARGRMRTPSGYVADGRVTPVKRAGDSARVDDFIVVRFKFPVITLYLRRDDLYFAGWKFQRDGRWIAANVERGNWDTRKKDWANPLAENRQAPPSLWGSTEDHVDVTSPSCRLNYTEALQVGSGGLRTALGDLSKYVPPTSPDGHPALTEDIQRAVERVAVNIAEAARFELVRVHAREKWEVSSPLGPTNVSAVKDWSAMTKFLFNRGFTPGQEHMLSDHSDPAQRITYTLDNRVRNGVSDPHSHPVIVVFLGTAKVAGENPGEAAGPLPS